MTAHSRLPRHLALALNLRGIAVYDPGQPPDRPFFTWLARKHQYRNVGFVPSLMDHPDVDIRGYQTFEPAALPLDSLETAAGHSDLAPSWVTTSLLAASAYVSPLFIHRSALAAFEPVATWRLESVADLPEDQVLRHLRIAGYGMLDAYAEATERGFEAVRSGSTDAERRDRRDFAATDGEERFWRLTEEITGETWVGGYFDPLPVVAMDEASAAISAAPEAAVGLGLVGGLAVDPPYD